jgi:putative pre-16S rRNA nuclease
MTWVTRDGTLGPAALSPPASVIQPVIDIDVQEPERGTSHSAGGTVLAFDFGERRIGVAVGELALRIAHPLETIHARTEHTRLEQIAHLVREWSPVLLVVGLPLHMDGSEHQLTVRCRRFARLLEKRFATDTSLVDERLTSHAAGQSLVEAGVHRRHQKGKRDQVAAQHILETFFSERNDAA